MRVKLFAALREQAGAREREVELADGAAVDDVWPALGLGDEPTGLVYAVNRAVRRPRRALADGDEVALIPPVSGGAFRLSDEPLSLEEVAREVASDEAGRSRRSSARRARTRAAATSSGSSTRPTKGWPRRRWSGSPTSSGSGTT